MIAALQLTAWAPLSDDRISRLEQSNMAESQFMSLSIRTQHYLDRQSGGGIAAAASRTQQTAYSGGRGSTAESGGNSIMEFDSVEKKSPQMRIARRLRSDSGAPSPLQSSTRDRRYLTFSHHRWLSSLCCSPSHHYHLSSQSDHSHRFCQHYRHAYLLTLLAPFLPRALRMWFVDTWQITTSERNERTSRSRWRGKHSWRRYQTCKGRSLRRDPFLYIYMYTSLFSGPFPQNTHTHTALGHRVGMRAYARVVVSLMTVWIWYTQWTRANTYELNDTYSILSWKVRPQSDVQWMSNDSARVCHHTTCTVQFGLFAGRHHCRACGTFLWMHTTTCVCGVSYAHCTLYLRRSVFRLTFWCLSWHVGHIFCSSHCKEMFELPEHYAESSKG